MTHSSVIYICPNCGSHDMAMDACSRWSRTKQEMVLSTTYDLWTCGACGNETRHAVEVPLITYEEAKAAFRLAQDGDPWGNVQHWRFIIAAEYDYNRDGAPAEWQYRPGLCRIEEPDGYAETTAAGMTDEDLRRFFDVLTRYRDKLEAAGRSY